MTINLTQDDLKALAGGDEVLDKDGNVLFKFVEESTWSQETHSDFQFKSIIFQDVKTDKFYEFEINRSGSPYTDFTYDYPRDGAGIYEVVKVTKTIYEWELVKNDPVIS